MKGVITRIERDGADHFRLCEPMPPIPGVRPGPALSVRPHLRPARTSVAVAVVFSRIGGVFPGQGQPLALDVAAAALVAGEA